MSHPRPPLPSFLPPPAPLPADITASVRREQQAARTRGETAGPAGTEERQRLEALARVRQEAAGRAPVPAPDGGWTVATDAGGTEV